LSLRRCPASPPFPYTTLFRSPRRSGAVSALRISAGSVLGHVPGVEGAVGELLAQLLHLVDQGLVDAGGDGAEAHAVFGDREHPRSEEHTSELQSRENLVCRQL